MSVNLRADKSGNCARDWWCVYTHERAYVPLVTPPPPPLLSLTLCAGELCRSEQVRNKLMAVVVVVAASACLVQIERRFLHNHHKRVEVVGEITTTTTTTREGDHKWLYAFKRDYVDDDDDGIQWLWHICKCSRGARVIARLPRGARTV